MKPEPSPFWKSKRVSQRDTFLLYFQYPEMRELLIMLDDRPIKSPSDELIIFHEQFNSLSEDQRAMVYEWANQKAQPRIQEKMLRQQLKAQMLPSLIQQEIQAEQEVIVSKRKEEYMKKHGLIATQEQQAINPQSPLYQNDMTLQSNQNNMIDSPEPEKKGLIQRFRNWRQKRKEQKQQKQLMKQIQAQQQQNDSNQHKQRKKQTPIIIHP